MLEHLNLSYDILFTILNWEYYCKVWHKHLFYVSRSRFFLQQKILEHYKALVRSFFTVLPKHYWFFFLPFFVLTLENYKLLMFSLTLLYWLLRTLSVLKTLKVFCISNEDRFYILYCNLCLDVDIEIQKPITYGREIFGN